MYAADHGHPDDAPNRQQRTELADYLGCHEEARARAWAAWAAELNPADWDAADTGWTWSSLNLARRGE